MQTAASNASVSMADIVADAMLEQAYGWLFQRRQNYLPDADCWGFGALGGSKRAGNPRKAGHVEVSQVL